MLVILVVFKYCGLLVKPGDEKRRIKIKRFLNSSKKLLYFEYRSTSPTYRTTSLTYSTNNLFNGSTSPTYRTRSLTYSTTSFTFRTFTSPVLVHSGLPVLHTGV